MGSELKAFTISKRFSGSTEPSSLKYVTLFRKKEVYNSCHIKKKQFI